MKKEHSLLQKITAVLLLLVFLFAIVPHEWIHHLIAHHQDTVEVIHHDMEIGSSHVHCKYLQVSVAPFTDDDFSIDFFLLPIYSVHKECLISFIAVEAIPILYLRGPPLS